MKISVSAASGVEAVTKRELYKLGYGDVPSIGGRMTFEGDEKAVCACNLFLRTANRVFIEFGAFKAKSFDDLFDGVSRIEWEKFLPADAKIDVAAKCVDSTIHAVSATQSVCKKAICERLLKCYKTLGESGERYKIEIALNKDFAVVSLDTSGSGLHRRGYRGLVGEAPLKETLAAAIILLSVWNPSRPFADLFCGSGTLPIEAAMIAKNIPAGGNRDFDFLHWQKFDSSAFLPLKQEALKNVKDEKLQIAGFDIDENQLKLARKHAELAGVAGDIHFQKADVSEFSSKKRYGVLFCNPPYGERLSDRKEIENLMRTYGKVYAELPDWSAYTITPVTDFERLFGKRATKKRKLYNGSIECCLYTMLGNPPVKNKTDK